MTESLCRSLIVSLALLLCTASAGCATQKTVKKFPPAKQDKAASRGITRAGYAIQFGAFSEVSNAERFARQLNGKGVDAFYFRKENSLYAVRFGDFATRDKARSAAEKLVREKMITGYFVVPPQDVPLRPVVPEIKTAPDPVLRKAFPPEKHHSAGEDAGRASTTGTGKDMGSIAARTAERFVGIPYRWGGDNVVEGMDCSGFVRAVFSLCGVNIPRTSAEQYRVGQTVDRGDLKDGDLVFFAKTAGQVNHVGIYAGNGRFVHAPRRGDDIKITPLDDDYFTKHFVGGRRYF